MGQTPLEFFDPLSLIQRLLDLLLLTLQEQALVLSFPFLQQKLLMTLLLLLKQGLLTLMLKEPRGLRDRDHSRRRGSLLLLLKLKLLLMLLLLLHLKETLVLLLFLLLLLVLLSFKLSPSLVPLCVHVEVEQDGLGRRGRLGDDGELLLQLLPLTAAPRS